MKFLPAAVLLVLAGFAGLLAEGARDDAGIVPSPGRIPLGGFEPLAVDLLYLRADELIQARRLPEAIAAVRLVTELQPRVPDGWAVLGHYVAWRNSESSGDPEEQWKYANEARKIFRRGLVHNPDSIMLHFAFGIFFLNRLAREEDIRPVAVRELGELPSALALREFKRCDELRPDDRLTISLVAESARVLGLRRLDAGDRDGGKDALRESLRDFERLIDPSKPSQVDERVREIRELLRDLGDR